MMSTCVIQKQILRQSVPVRLVARPAGTGNSGVTGTSLQTGKIQMLQDKSTESPTALPQLLTAMEQILGRHPQGLKEFDLIRLLNTHYQDLFPAQDLSDPIALFRTHFVLMHHLYTLQEQLYRDHRGWLEIGLVTICLHPLRNSGDRQISSAEQTPEPVREYYLNISHLNATDREQVEALLSSFWQRIGNIWNDSDALSVLGLSSPCSWDEIRHQYRRLAKQNHPDHGGSADTMQRINSAYASLKKHYQPS